MATRADIRRIALSLPEVSAGAPDFAFGVPEKGKVRGFVWSWKERINPKKGRVPHPTIVAVRVANLGHKEAMLWAEPTKFFTEPHYNGFPAVMVRIEHVTVREMRVLLDEAWRCVAPKALLAHVKASQAERTTARDRAPRAPRPPVAGTVRRRPARGR